MIGVGLYNDKDKQTYMTATSLHTKRVYADTLIPVDSETNAINIGDSTTSYKLSLNGKNVATTEGAEFTSFKLINEDGTKYVEVAKNASVDDGITIKGKVDAGDDLNVYGTVYTDTLEARTTNSPVAIKKAKIETLENITSYSYTYTIHSRLNAEETGQTKIKLEVQQLAGTIKRCILSTTTSNKIDGGDWTKNTGYYCITYAYIPTSKTGLIQQQRSSNFIGLIDVYKWTDSNKTAYEYAKTVQLYCVLETDGYVMFMFPYDTTTDDLIACTDTIPGCAFYYY